MIWAWERPENLQFIDSSHTGVAYLAGTLFLSGDLARYRPRMQPLSVPAGTYVLPVVRIETDRYALPILSMQQRQESASILLKAVGENGLQVDFDATVSQQDFYGALLGQVRSGMSAGKILSVTTLASRCWGQRWAAHLPVDELVVMSFRLGPQAAYFKKRLAEGQPDNWIGPKLSLGISLDEPISFVANASKRVYLFKPALWNKADQRLLLR